MAGIEYMHQLWLLELECLVVKLQQVEKMEATPKSPGSRMRDRAHVNLFHAREYRKRVAGGISKELGECKTEENYTRFLHAAIHSECASHVHHALEMIKARIFSKLVNPIDAENINSNEGKRGELYYQLGNGLYRIGDGESAKKALEDCLKFTKSDQPSDEEFMKQEKAWRASNTCTNCGSLNWKCWCKVHYEEKMEALKDFLSKVVTALEKNKHHLKELGECKTEENYTRFLHATIHSERDSHVHHALEMIKSRIFSKLVNPIDAANINSNEGKRGEFYYQLGNGLYRIGDGERAKKALEDCLKARNLLVNVELILRVEEPKNKISKSTLPKHMVVTGGLAPGVTCGSLSKSKLLKHVAVAGGLTLGVICTMILSWEKLDEFDGGIKKAGELEESIEKMIGKDSYPTGFFQISIAPEDQEKTTFTCSYSTFAYRRIPFGLCNVHATFQRCMTMIFHDMVEDFMEVFMDDFSIFGQKISRARIEVDRAKIDVIAKFPYPTNVKGVRSFLEHVGFYRGFIEDLSMIYKPMIQILMKYAKFDFSNDCKKAFNIMKEKLTITPIIISPDWNVPFELMCDASDFAVGSVLGQRIDGKFKPVYYARKTLNNAQEHYTTTEKELLVVVLSFDKFRPYLIISKTVVYTDHSALKYLLSK
ncbi:reverse transcriptase domain-containing protein [Tanacetum coccineum]|uniref:Reverse transcriptase domain-containing protein n=1 Tax=Tanacetum coccineum TaxID=301880 RepID=A0ABQ4YTN8_9ASTR